MANLQPGFLRLAARRPALTVDVMVSGPFTQAGGSGGWEVVARPFRTGFTDWVGRDPLTLTVPLLFDGFATSTSVEKAIITLERMAIPHGDDDPPTLRATGPIPHREKNWVINGIDWGEPIYHRDTTENVAYRVRQACTITLLELVEDDRLERLAKRAGKGGSRGKKKPREPYTVKKGDTLMSIAAAKLGAAKRWKEIKRMNPGIRDPKRLKVGQKIKLP